MGINVNDSNHAKSNQNPPNPKRIHDPLSIHSPILCFLILTHLTKHSQAQNSSLPLFVPAASSSYGGEFFNFQAPGFS